MSNMTAREILALREKYLLPCVMKYFTEPIHIVKGEMEYVYDDKGKRYIDAFAAVVTVSAGHCHPDIVGKVQEQVGRLQHITTLYMTESIVLLAKKLAEITPGALSKSFITNSGTEANELAALLAKNSTGRHEFLGLRHSFHGRTLMSMSLTGQSIWRHSTPYVFGVSHTPSAYCYRCPMGRKYPGCNYECAREAEEVIKYSTSGKIAALFAEPIQGFGGCVTPPPDYFRILYDIVKKYGGLFVSDEVQTGFGRTGEKWFGIESWGVTPDMMTFAKGFGNGVPVGAVITTPEVAASMNGKTHFSTYGGNPVTCVAALATVETIEKLNYMENSKVMGNLFKEHLAEMQKKHPIIGDVRGMGLMLGIELVKNRETKEPAAAEMLRVMDLCKDRGVFIGKGGMLGNVVRIKPPMCIKKDSVLEVLKALDESFSIVEKEAGIKY